VGLGGCCLVPPPANLPLQDNDRDCGVFVIAYAERLSVCRPWDFTQRDMAAMRELLAHEQDIGALVSEDERRKVNVHVHVHKRMCMCRMCGYCGNSLQLSVL
jgi:hypothetical protein